MDQGRGSFRELTALTVNSFQATESPPRRSPSSLFTCSVVLSVSMGMMAILQTPAVTDAAPVFTATGRSYGSRYASTPALAAVSPNLEKEGEAQECL